MALTDEALAAARDAHDQHALGHDFGAQAVAHLKQLAALEKPLLEALEAADLAEAGAVGDELDEAGAVDQQPLFFEQRRAATPVPGAGSPASEARRSA